MSLKLAVELALGNPVHNLPRMAAVIRDRRGNVIGAGLNSRKSDPMAAKYGRHPDAVYPHAELAAIKDALKEVGIDDLTDCTLSVARVLKNGTEALAEPCVGCRRAINEFQIGKVEWTK